MIKVKIEYDNILSDLINSLSKSLNCSITYNTNAEIDLHLERAKHDNCSSSMDWLLLQFMPLIASISIRDTFHKKNSFTGKNTVYTFDYIKKEDMQDLIPCLIIEFKKSTKNFNWETPFNSWIKGQLEWYAINYHNNNNKYYQREITSLNSSYSDISNCEDEEDEFVNKIENHKGFWHKDLSQRDNLKDRQIYRIITDFVKKKFNAKKQRIFRMHFLENMSMSDIAIKEGYHYHSTISNLVKEIRFELMEYLSKIDEEYDEMYDKYFIKKYTKDELKDSSCITSDIKTIKEGSDAFVIDFEDFSTFKAKPIVINFNIQSIEVVHKLVLSSI